MPVNAVVFVVIGVLVIIAVASFFILSSGQQMGRAEAQQAYATACRQFCQGSIITTEEIVEGVAADKKFLQACEVNGIAKGQTSAESATYCIKACPCEISSDLEGHRIEAVDFLNSRTY